MVVLSSSIESITLSIHVHPDALTRTNSLIGYPLSPPRATVKSLFPLHHLPLEPPPPRNGKFVKVVLHISNLTLVYLSPVAAPTPSMLATTHPSLKLPWIFYRLQLLPLLDLSNSVYVFSNLCFCILGSMFALCV